MNRLKKIKNRFLLTRQHREAWADVAVLVDVVEAVIMHEKVYGFTTLSPVHKPMSVLEEEEEE